MKASTFFALMEFGEKQRIKTFGQLNEFLKGGKSND